VANGAQLEWERRTGRPVAAAAFLGAALLLAGTIVRSSVVRQSDPDPERKFLVSINDDSAAFLLSGVLQALSFVALAIVVWFLFRATRHRRTELPGWALPLVWLGPLLLAVAGIVSDLDRLDAADRFLDSGPRTNPRAEDLLEDRSTVPVAIGGAGTLATAFALVLVSLHAMRAGLLSRFMGFLGIIVGALYVLPLFGGPVIVQSFWLAALGLIFLDRWPRGRGPAWDTGEAVPWPGAADKARAVAEAEELPPPGEEEPVEAPRRKRKRRH
jgi:hypothetical protein